MRFAMSGEEQALRFAQGDGARLSAALADRYRMERELGSGGTSAVTAPMHGVDRTCDVRFPSITAPAASKGFRIACADLAPRHAYLVHGGEASWPMANGVTAVSLPDLVKRLGER